MPTYSYKGYDFDVDHAPTAEEFTKMSAYVDTLPEKTAPQEKPTESLLDRYMPEVAKGAVGTVAAGLDIAAGVPKSILSTLAAPVRTLLTGNPEESRQWAQQQAENIVGTPSKGMAGLGVPAEYLQESQPYKAMMTPFEKMGQGIEAAGKYTTEKTGSEAAGGAAK